MKYFTQEIIEKWNSEDPATQREAYQQWDNNIWAYETYIENILPQLTRKCRSFFKQTHIFHDGFINKLFVDHSPARFCRNRYFPIELEVVHPELPFIYMLTYSKIRNFSCNYTFHDRYPNYVLDSWAYDEFTLLEDKWMRHEILLHDDSVILIEFKHFTYSRRKDAEHINFKKEDVK